MINRLKISVLILSVALFLSWIAYAQTLSLYGSLYRYNPSASTPTPMRGYEVYVYNQPKGWIGPSITDTYGRYAFYDLSAGRYLMRIYNVQVQQKSLVWEQEVQVPGANNPIVLR